MRLASSTKTAIQTARTAKTATTAIKTSAKSVKAIENGGQKLLTFSPKILDGNKKYGMTHILKRHASESSAKNVSKFLPGMGKKEITGLVNEACSKGKSWVDAENGMKVMTVNLGRTIGSKMRCGSPTGVLKVVFDPKTNAVHTSYPH